MPRKPSNAQLRTQKVKATWDAKREAAGGVIRYPRAKQKAAVTCDCGTCRKCRHRRRVRGYRFAPLKEILAITGLHLSPRSTLDPWLWRAMPEILCKSKGDSTSPAQLAHVAEFGRQNVAGLKAMGNLQ